MKKVKISSKKMSPSGKITKYIMMILLVVIVIFTGIYIVNINKAITRQESFVISEESAKKSFKIVMIYSTSCGYCTKFKPVFQSVAGRFMNVADVEMHEAGSPGSSAYMSKVQGVPFMLIVKDGQVVATKAGYMEEAQFKAWLDSFVV